MSYIGNTFVLAAEVQVGMGCSGAQVVSSIWYNPIITQLCDGHHRIVRHCTQVSRAQGYRLPVPVTHHNYVICGSQKASALLMLASDGPPPLTDFMMHSLWSLIILISQQEHS